MNNKAINDNILKQKSISDKQFKQQPQMLTYNPLASVQYEQLLQIFSAYLNDMNIVINTVKKSIYQILNIQLNPSQTIIHPTIPSVSANGKKTLDDMKRISSILRGYSRSKNVQRQEQSTRRSRVANSSISRQSRLSKYSNTNSSVNFSRVQRVDSLITRKEEISMVTFQLPHVVNNRQGENDGNYLLSRMRSYQSMSSLNKNIEHPQNQQHMTESYQTAKFNHNIHAEQNSPIYQQQQNTPMNRKRAKTLQKSCSTQSFSRIITQTQTKFKQCLEKHDSGMNQIIKRNSQCLSILKDIRKNIKNKKNKKTREAPSKKDTYNGSRKSIAKYQAMTPSSQKDLLATKCS